MDSRKSFVRISYDGKDITEALTASVLEFSYSDKASRESDELTLKCHDRENNWIGDWYPKKSVKKTTTNEIVSNAVSGTILRAAICVENWDFEGDNRELDCGSFEIDSVDFAGPPDTVTIKALSIPISSNIRNGEKTRAWEETTLQKIAQDIADDAGLELFYDVESEIQLDRVDQEEKADMAFLLELSDQYGVALKVTDNKVILFEEEVYESKEVVDIFDKREYGNGGRILSYSFSQDTSGTVCKVVSSYKDPKSGQLVTAEFEPPEPPATGQIAYLNIRPGDLSGDNFREGNDTSSEASGGTFDTGFNAFNDSSEDFDNPRSDRTDNAKRQAKAVARAKNKNEWTCTLTVRGNPKMVGSVNININGFGAYSGKYSVFDVKHSAVGNYKTVLMARRVLVGY